MLCGRPGLTIHQEGVNEADVVAARGHSRIGRDSDRLAVAHLK